MGLSLRADRLAVLLRAPSHAYQADETQQFRVGVEI